MKAAILVHDASGGVIIRAYMIAKALIHLGYEVQIVGFCTKEIFSAPPQTLKLKLYSVSLFPSLIRHVKQVWADLNVDIIYALKPRLLSFGLALLKKRSKSVKIFLDMDDWEMGWSGGEAYRYSATPGNIYNGLFRKKGVESLKHPDHPLYIRWMERLVPRADKLTVSTRYLQKRYGGVYLPNGKDTELFDPSLYASEEIRKKMGWDKYKILMFPGAARPHKGLEDVLEAMNKLKDTALKLVLVGRNPYDNYDELLLQKYPNLIIQLENQPFEKMPEILAAAHVVVLPQKDTESARAQFPLKLTDAMAMAKPIIATQVGDIPEVLSGIGYLVGANNPQEIAEKIKWILAHYAEASQLGKLGRQRCVAMYGTRAMAQTIQKLIEMRTKHELKGGL